jgi:Recombination endonuclease VII
VADLGQARDRARSIFSSPTSLPNVLAAARGAATGIACSRSRARHQPRGLNMTNPFDNGEAKDAARRERKNAYARARYAAKREQITAQKRHRYATDPEYRAEKLARDKRNRGKRDWIRWRYGLSQQDFDRMIARQHGLCLMCWKKFTRTPCIDHSHATGVVRGLLCTNCNFGFGHFFENPEFLRRAADCAEFFTAHEQAILRGDAAALQQAGRLRTVLLEVDISSLLPPEFRTPQPLDASGKPPPRKSTTPTVAPTTTVQARKAEKKKHAQSRSDRRKQRRPHDGARDPARAAAAVRPGRASARRQSASGRALPGRQGGRRPSQRDQGSARPHRRQPRDGRQRTR